MEVRKVKILVTSTVFILLILPLILWLVLGLSTAFFILAAFDLALIVIIFIWVFLQHISVHQRQASMVRRAVVEGEELRIEYSFLRKVAGLPTKFRYEALQAATNDFQSLIGCGSSAFVFKGILDDGTTVAIKRISGSDQGESEFRSEVAAIASVQHVNLVHLLGYCISPKASARFLVYEFAHNGSLDKWIFPRKGIQPERLLQWPLRYRVAVDVAKALAYLHHDCRARVLHLDIKPENILLDESFHALVADFGLSKLMEKDVSRIVTTVRGTRGYLAPEWFVGSGVSERCDVFSYGMVLLELIAGKRSVRLVGDTAAQRVWHYLPRIVIDKVRQGKMMEVVDERLMSSTQLEEREVRILVYVALWCIQDEAKRRPSMARVVDMLEGRIVVEPPPPDIGMHVLDMLTMEYMSPVVGNNGGGAAATNGGLRQTTISSSYTFTDTILSGR